MVKKSVVSALLGLMLLTLPACSSMEGTWRDPAAKVYIDNQYLGDVPLIYEVKGRYPSLSFDSVRNLVSAKATTKDIVKIERALGAVVIASWGCANRDDHSWPIAGSWNMNGLEIKVTASEFDAMRMRYQAAISDGFLNGTVTINAHRDLLGRIAFKLELDTNLVDIRVTGRFVRAK